MELDPSIKEDQKKQIKKIKRTRDQSEIKETKIPEEDQKIKKEESESLIPPVYTIHNVV